MTSSSSPLRCKPSEGFKEDGKEPLLDLSLTDSTELWLIQWPLRNLKPADFNGKEITLQLQSDGKLGSIETSSGKTYEMVCSTVNKPDATVFLSSGSDSKIVGKISRRICLVHYPEPTAVKNISYPSASSQKSGGSQKSSMPILPIISEVEGGSNTLHGTSHATLTSDRTLGQSIESTKHSKKKRRRGSTTSSEEASKSAGQTSRGSRPDCQVTLNSTGSFEHSKSKAKKKIKIEQ